VAEYKIEMERAYKMQRFFKLKKRIARLPIFLILTINLLLIAICIFSLSACNKEDGSLINEESTFKLSSPEIGPDSLLPAEYTCDGESATLPLAWSGFPENTEYFALIMHHEASPTDIHWYWVIYDIPVSVQSLPKNVTGVGTLGNNSVNSNIGYAPPCSQGPGSKKYIYTIYALSAEVELSVPNSEVNREVLLDAIKNITLASTTLIVIYSRNI
jgi:Raf kinase inhibitor-like YbhB/YbcL family protein